MTGPIFSYTINVYFGTDFLESHLEVYNFDPAESLTGIHPNKK